MRRLLRRTLTLGLSVLALHALPLHALEVDWQNNWTVANPALTNQLYRSMGGAASFQLYRTVSPTATSALDLNLTPGDTPSYYLTASNNVGESFPSNTVCATVVAGIPCQLIAPSGGVLSGVVALTTTFDVTSVQYVVDGAIVATVLTAPYLFQLDTRILTDGAHTVQAIATSTQNGAVRSPVVTITVSNAAALALGYAFNEGSGTTIRDAASGNVAGVMTAATWSTAGQYGSALQFGAANAKVVSGVYAFATQRSYLLWVNLGGSGGGGYGRLFDHRQAGSEVELLYYDSPANVLRYVRVWSGGLGSWSIPAPAFNVWRHVGVTYDAALSTNVPHFYLDGVEQQVTVSSTPSGIPLTNGDALVIGNRGDGTRWFGGKLDDVRIYNAILTAPQILTFMNGGLS